MSDQKAVIKNADMSEDMQQYAVGRATQARPKYNLEKAIAAYINKEFDKKYNPTWHCFVGRKFGSYVTHETKRFIYFYLGQVAILLFQVRLVGRGEGVSGCGSDGKQAVLLGLFCTGASIRISSLMAVLPYCMDCILYFLCTSQ
ncbi:dynein light chain 2, cytoplasmic-like [Cebus imitator]|nr:dynein light chain 2, cytoplasmic-like [Cebus imitator]XP_037599669.1 dynein light chain 2, cytoplasmic-like [Cebus imitator]XP_037599670.1 dynein light chain 2, cytoplasmic-like [Cebus imitator]